MNPWTHELLLVPRALFLYVWRARRAPAPWELAGLAEAAAGLVSAVWHRCPRAAVCLAQVVGDDVGEAEARAQREDVSLAVAVRLDSLAGGRDSERTLRVLAGGESVVCRLAGERCDAEELRRVLVEEPAREGYYRREYVPPAYALLRARVQEEAAVRPWVSWEQYLQVGREGLGRIARARGE